MLSNTQKKLIKTLHTKKGRKKNGLCLVEGKKVVDTAGGAVEFTFSPDDSSQFRSLVTTETPQNLAAVAKTPEFSKEDILAKDTIVILDGVQDPGNVGSILRLCLGFDAGLVLVESADVSGPKVVRSSVGAMFQVPWMNVARSELEHLLDKLGRPIYRLEKTKAAANLAKTKLETPLALIAGSEGTGIKTKIKGTSIFVNHNSKLESLNVGHALAIALYAIYIS